VKLATDSTYVYSVAFDLLGLPSNFDREKLTVEMKELNKNF